MADKLNSVRAGYEELGVGDYYETHGDDYVNPHEFSVHQALEAALGTWQLDLSHVLDLACGSGEVTLPLLAKGAGRVDGIDPYTGKAYRRRTGQRAERFTFEQIGAGALSGRRWSLIVCSYALHLVPPSRLPTLCWQLAGLTPQLLVLTPHKRPDIASQWQWDLVGEIYEDRVRARLYRSRLELPSE